MSRPTIDLIYFNAGGGHRAAASALEAVIQSQGRPWTVHSVNLLEVLDPKGTFKRVTGMAPEDLYNKRLARGWTLGLDKELKLLQGMIRLGHTTLVERLRQHWLRSEPDLVVSLVPNFNRAMIDALAGALPGVPYVTVMTDLADHPPGFWIEPWRGQHLVCGTPRALAQAREAGMPASHVHAMSGMILRPSFYEARSADRAAARRALGLAPDQATGVVMFGGQGAKVMLSIARQLDDVQLIFLCGHNESLARQLRALPGRAPRAVLGFTPEVPAYLQLGDFLIGKPGPGSLSEAVHLGVPVVTVRNAWTMPQERYNTEWLLEHGVGVVGRSLSRVRPLVDDLLARREQLHANTRRLRNRAVFEVPEILAQLLAQSAAGGRADGERALALGR